MDLDRRHRDWFGLQFVARRELDGGWRAAWWFILPSLIGFLAFFLIPTVRGIYLSCRRTSRL